MPNKATGIGCFGTYKFTNIPSECGGCGVRSSCRKNTPNPHNLGSRCHNKDPARISARNEKIMKAHREVWERRIVRRMLDIDKYSIEIWRLKDMIRKAKGSGCFGNYDVDDKDSVNPKGCVTCGCMLSCRKNTTAHGGFKYGRTTAILTKPEPKVIVTECNNGKKLRKTEVE